ncbi:MAG: ABC transporter substrate-binding protein [Nanoarchaeota archaeon]
MNKALIGLIGVLLLLVACGQQPGSSAKEPIKIGSILPLTGDGAAMGLSLQRAIQLAEDEINVAGGIHGRPLNVIFEDGQCTGKQGSNAANKLVNIDQVPAIIGGMCSPETLAAAPIAEGKTVLLSPGSSNPTITQAGDYTFRDYPSDAFAGKFAAEYMYNQLEKRKVAILSCLNDYCKALGEVFKKRFTELGGEVPIRQEYEMDARDLRSQLSQIKETNPEAIYFLGFTEGSISGLIQAKELGINIPLLGGDSWDDPDIHKKAGKAAEGIQWTVTNTPANEVFKNKINAKFGDVDITVATAQAYDAAHILADILRKVGPDAAKIKDELYKVKDYQGVSGTIGFDENGDLLGAKYVVKTIKKGKPEEVYK